jgi:hypothetical protein
MLLPLELPAGVYKNGTEYQGRGRWIDSNLVRWTDSTLQPMKGWRTRSEESVTGKIRGLVSWKDNSNGRWLAGGTHSNLYVYTSDGTQYDITPTGFTSGNESSTFPSGYGYSLYGTSLYGTPRPEGDVPQPATTWSLDTFGQFLLACSNDDGKVYQWQLDVNTDATVISEAPEDNSAIVVTEERFLFCLGADGNPKKVQWADRESLTVWTPLATNEAGDIELQTTGSIQCAKRVQGQTLILTTNDAHVATYQGAPYVYGFERVGSSCGIISKAAVSAVDAGAFWMGNGSFYFYGGGKTQELPCEVIDHVFTDMNVSQSSKIFAVTNAKFNEILWFYPSSSAIENDRYVAYNYKDNNWHIGTMSRTAGVDAGAYDRPTYTGTNGYIYEHEVGFNYDNDSPFVESGAIAIGNGDNVMSVTSMIPDENTQGDVVANFYAKFYPNGDEYAYGAYNMSNPTDLRITGRQLRIRLTGNTNSDWRVGVNRLEIKQGSKR